MKTAILNLCLYAVLPAICIAAHVCCQRSLRQSAVPATIRYSSSSASEVYIVWNILDGPPADARYFPSGSLEKSGLIWSRAQQEDRLFSVTIHLPRGTHYYYWAVQTRDANGAPTEVWDGGGEQECLTGSISYGLFRPGYLVLLAGLLPILLTYAKKRREPLRAAHTITLRSYIPQLDAIRAIAVILVIIHHWLPEDSWINYTPNGRLGVNTFFVLSGFLITGILLRARDRLESKPGSSPAHMFRSFYVRRTLRIFPIYYLLLTVLWLLGDPELHHRPIPYISYTSNFLFFFGEYFPARLAHLWSLAVEEQFYLIWPWLMLLTG